MTWYVPSDFYLKPGDEWQFSNSAAGGALLTINVSFQ
jgi:hypothetical protein